MSQPKDNEKDLNLPKQPVRRATPHFLVDELACRCCGLFTMPAQMLVFLEDVREEYGRAMVINSAQRCKAHNAKVGGKPNSAHVLGLAVDVKIGDGYERNRLIRAAIKHGVEGIGVYASFIHIDIMK